MPSVIGLDDARKPDAPVVFDKASRKKAGNVSEGGGGPAPWKGNLRGPSAAFSQEGEEGAKLDRQRARERGSAAGRGDVPHRHAAAHLPRAACRRGALRRRQPHRARLDAGGVSSRRTDRQAICHSARQGPRHRRSRRRRFWLEGQPRCRDNRGDRTGARGKSAGAGGVRPARRTLRHRLSAGDRSEDRAAPLARWSAEGADLQRLGRHGGRDQFDARRTCAPDLSGRSQGARRFRRHQQSAARRAVPRTRRTADGVRAGAGRR